MRRFAPEGIGKVELFTRLSTHGPCRVAFPTVSRDLCTALHFRFKVLLFPVPLAPSLSLSLSISLRRSFTAAPVSIGCSFPWFFNLRLASGYRVRLIFPLLILGRSFALKKKAKCASEHNDTACGLVSGWVGAGLQTIYHLFVGVCVCVCGLLRLVRVWERAGIIRGMSCSSSRTAEGSG